MDTHSALTRVPLAAIRAARARIAPFIAPTPLLPFHGIDGLWLKAENLQVTGSFKVRGAASRMTLLPGEQPVITASSGNHGQAVAYVAARLGRPAVIVVPEDVPGVKAEGIARWGARLIRRGRTSEERVTYAEELAEDEGWAYVPPYDDHEVMAGQGTIGLEIMEALPEVRTVVVPVSGGGLISGIAAAMKALRPEVQVVGAEPDAVPRFGRSRAAGRPIRLPFAATVADGLRVIEPGRLTWEVGGRLVDRFVTATDEALLAAVRRLLLEAHLLVEPSGAAGLAAVEGSFPPGPTAVVLSGGNVDPHRLLSLLS